MTRLFTMTLTVLCILNSTLLTAQMDCNITVDAGNDVTICDAPQAVALSGTISGDYIEASWEPANLLDNPNSLTPTATITETTTFTFTVRSFSEENLIFNGDFNEGDTGFTSDYEHGTGGPFGLLSMEGLYAIANNAEDTHTLFPNCGEHTGDGGDMMVVNASGLPNNVWCQTITVEPNTEYAFSAWITSVSSQNPAELLFQINGVQLGELINPTAIICAWQQFYAIWDSGNATTAEICLINVNNDPAGNDFALDDLAFNPVCITTDEITIEVPELNADWTSPGMVCNNSGAITLNDLLDADATSGGTWTVAGTGQNTITPSDYSSPTILNVVYEVTQGPCSESVAHNINIILPPQPTFELPDEACIDEAFTLTYTGNGSGAASYNWNFGGLSADPGNGQGPQMLSTATPGTYTVVLDVTQNGCTSQPFSQSVTVVEPPLSTLDVSCSSTANSVEFEWPASAEVTAFFVNVTSGQTGVPTSQTSYRVDNLTPGETVEIEITAFFVNGPCGSGTFTASCTAVNCPTMTASLSGGGAICSGESSTVTLNLMGDPGPYNVTYDLGGSTTSLTNVGNTENITLSPTTTSVFSIVSITNTNNPNCSIALPTPISIEVDEPLFAGTAQIVAPICEGDGSTEFILFNLLDNADGGGIWTETSAIPSTDNAFSAPWGSFDPSGQVAGTYTFTYTLNEGTNCPESSTELSIVIGETPIADAGEDIDIGCNPDIPAIGGSNTSMGGNLMYTWETSDGGNLATPDMPTTEIDAPGTYTLTVRNTTTGCSAVDMITITESGEAPEIFTTTTDASCAMPNGGSIRIDSVVGGMEPYSFSLNGAPFTSDTVFEGLSAGAFTLVVEDVLGCQSSIEDQIEGEAEISVAIIAENGQADPIVEAGIPFKLNLLLSDPTVTIDTIIWTPEIPGCDGCSNPAVTPLTTTTFSVMVITSDGCTATDLITLSVETKERIFIPNAFSPNDDGFNDVFFVQAGPEVAQITEFQIMDRWGNQVFEAKNTPANDASFGWDGSFNGKQLNPGVFVYYIELELFGGNRVIKAGAINLMQ